MKEHRYKEWRTISVELAHCHSTKWQSKNIVCKQYKAVLTLKQILSCVAVTEYVVFTLVSYALIITPQVQRERGKVIGIGVHICIYIIYITEKSFTSKWKKGRDG